MPRVDDKFYEAIINNEWLTDGHIDVFSQLLANKFGYDVRQCWLQMLPVYVNPIEENKKHIQILHRLDGEYCDYDAVKMSGGHWVCSYYDTNNIYIFDSLNNKNLDIHYKRFLQSLYPFYSFDTNPVIFPSVQQQHNSNDCGVFAIAFAISLAFGDRPENLRYNVHSLRQHLLQIYRTEVIIPFPTVVHQDEQLVEVQTKNGPRLMTERVKANYIEIEKITTKRVKISEPPLKRRKRQTRSVILCESEKNKILRGDKLNDEHISMFGALISKYTDYNHCDTLYLQKPNLIEQIPVWKKHIQILYSTYANSDMDHWVCSFYNGQHIYIYDSLNQGKLHEDHFTFLKRLYPFYNFNKNTIFFPKVQSQENSVDCGVFAIAFAVSILYNQKPESIIYDYSLMRQHLSKMLESDKICHFPATSIANVELTIPELQVVRKKEYAACYARKSRYERRILKTQQETCNKNAIESIGTIRDTVNDSTNNNNVNLPPYIIKALGAKQKCLDVKRKVISDSNVTSDMQLTPDSNTTNKYTEITTTPSINESIETVSDIETDHKMLNTDFVTVSDSINNSNADLPPYIINALEAKKEWLHVKKEVITENNNTSDMELTPDLNAKRKHTEINNTPSQKRTRRSTIYQEACKGKNDEVKFDASSNVHKCDNKHEESNNINYIFRSKLPVEKYIEKLYEVIQSTGKKEREKICKNNNDSQYDKELKTHEEKHDEIYVSPEENIEDKNDEVESRLIAERIMKWVLHRRSSYLKNLKHILKLLNTKSNDILKNLPGKKDQRIKTLCGKSLHTDKSESYFYEMSYSFNLKNVAIAMNSEGQATNILPLINNIKNKKKGMKQWLCNDNCKFVIDNIPSVCDNYESLLNELKTLNEKNISIFLRNLFVQHSHAIHLGHPLSCYMLEKYCSSTFVAVEVLSPHYPKVRALKRSIYRLNHVHKQLLELDCLLESADYEKLNSITNSVSEVAKILYKDDAKICLDEDKIMKENHSAFTALKKRSLDTPHLSCISCRKLCCKTKGLSISKLIKPIENRQWAELMNFLDQKHLAKTDFICTYCLDKFRKTVGPPTCILNNLYIVKVPDEISTLNDYERMLIQRAKTFQVVQRMGTVTKKNMPNHMKIQKVVGRTFYLPLPMEETLKKICPTQAAISNNQEFYILVNGLPTKSNKVWQNLVDLQKVFHALTWLKKNNPYYSEITLPDQYEKLLDGISLQDVEFQFEKKCEESDENNIDEFNGKIDSSNEKVLKDNIASQLDNFISNPADNSISQEQVNRSPFLTQVHDRESYCESYTFYPLHNKRIAETATNLYQMKKIREKPLDNRLATIEFLCFPELYPSGINGLHEERALKLTDQSYAQLRLLSEDSRYRLNQQYLFHLLYETNIRQLNAGIYHALNIINPRQRYTAQGYLEQLKSGGLEGNLNTIFERLRNSAAYWKTPRNNLNCMIRYYGPATWFLTLSPSEWLWTDLVEYIRQVNSPHFDKCSENECIARDPVSVSRFLDNKFHAMMDFLLSKDNPIGKISHYFWRREYQGRGTQHWHLILWVVNAPIMGKNSNDEVREFITKYVTCRLPNENVSPVLYRRVNTHQRHNHNSYCLRNKKEKSGKVLSRCRFGFPRPTTEEFILREAAISIVGRRQLKTKSRLYDLPRSTQEISINDYNPTILCAWEGNMDIQFIGESSTLLTQYCTKYTTKFETATISDSVHDINATNSLRQRLWSFAFRSLNHREIGALEAADTLLGIPLYATDSNTTIRWIDVNMIRNRKLKSREDVENLNPDSTDIFCPSLVDNYYPNRPTALESISLYEFATWYDIVKVVPKNESIEVHQIGPKLFIKKRSRGYLIDHYRYNVDTYPENYFHALLLLYQPWRDTDELKNGFDTYTESFAAKKDVLQNASEYHKNLIDLQKGLENIKQQIEKIESDNKNSGQNNGSNSDDSDVDDDVADDFKDIAEKAVADKNLPEMIAQLNADQSRIFKCVQNALASNDRPLRLCVSGEGGTGKSRLIDTIRCWIKEDLKKETAVTAPTGLAAFNISGLTAHRVFRLPVEHGSIPKYTELSDVALKMLRLQFKNVILIIIDEISMISNVTLLYINQRLIEIFNTADVDDGWFGGMHIVTFGDFLQLPPVRQDPVYQTLAQSTLTKLMGSLGTINLWTELFCYDELRINMRQKTDQSYGDLLSRLRVGAVTSDDIKLLEQRLIRIDPSLSYDDRLRTLCNYINKLPVETVVLLPTCKQCELLNFEMLKEISSEEILLIADDQLDCPRNVSKKATLILQKLDNDSSNTAGLERVIIIKLGAKIMIRRNIDVSLGLVNGTICHVTAVSKSLDGTNIESITVRLSNGHDQKIERVDAKFQIMNGAYVIRKQFPISLSYGITIHKSQGLSLQNAVVDAGNSIFTCGQTYVALSRVTTLQGLHLINFDPHKMKANVPAIEEYNRLRKIYRSDLPQIEIPHRQWATVPDFSWAIPQQDLNPEHNNNLEFKKAEWKICGLQNNDGVYSYINATLQCIFHSTLIRKKLLNNKNTPFTILQTILRTL